MRAKILAFWIGALAAAVAGCGKQDDHKPGFKGIDTGYDSKPSKGDKP